MQTFGAFLVSVLAASSFTAAVPTKGHIGIPASSMSVPAGNFSAPTIRNPNFARVGPISYAKVFKKFGKPIPADLAAAASAAASQRRKRTTGSATTTPTESDVEYLTPVKIGTPAQTLQLDFDTGSSDLWVFSSETPSSQVDGQTTYKPAKSSSSKKLSGQTWEISYGDGSSSSGDVYTDVVNVGGLSVKTQAVEAAQQVSSEFTSDPSESLLGLAFSSINMVSPKQQKTFFDNAKSSLDQPLFTADLKHNADGKYNFGYIDSSAYTGDIASTPVDDGQGFWTFTAKGYAIGTTKSTKSISGIADTGTTLLLLPNSVVTAYYKKVKSASLDNSQGGYTFTCGTTLPDFSFGVGDATVTVPGEYINFAETGSGKKCFGGIQSDDGIGFSIFGDVALKAAFVVFDAGNMQLGWAAKDL